MTLIPIVSKSRFFFGGDGGIRTHVPLRTTAFRVRLVMTTSIRLQIFTCDLNNISYIACYCKENYRAPFFRPFFWPFFLAVFLESAENLPSRKQRTRFFSLCLARSLFKNKLSLPKDLKIIFPGNKVLFSANLAVLRILFAVKRCSERKNCSCKHILRPRKKKSGQVQICV